MAPWMLVEAFGHECLFGFATFHPSTGGLSWTLSKMVIEFSASADRARTESGRVYQLGRQISLRDLDEEGRIALRVLLSCDDYPGRDDDVAWLTSQKMGRHLGERAPRYEKSLAVEWFFEKHLGGYLECLTRLRHG